MAKKSEITVKDVTIKTIAVNGIDYICITDIARQKNEADPNGVIANWMRNRNTVEFLGIWETLNNPNFNPLEFEGFRKEAGLNACHHQRTHLPLEYGEYQRRAHQRWHSARRTSRKTQPDCHSTDAGAGGE